MNTKHIASNKQRQALHTSSLSNRNAAADLISAVLDLEVLGRLLGDPAAEVELVDLAGLVPQWRDVVHDELSAGLLAAGGRRGWSRGALRSLGRVPDTTTKLMVAETSDKYKARQ